MKLKPFTILFLVLLIQTSCYTIDKPKKPNNLLTEDEMVVILVDMALMSSAKGVNKKKIEDNGIIPDKYIFERHNIDSLRFSESNNYYAYKIETYSNIYDKVKDSLTKLRDHYKVIETKEKKKKARKDSIKKANRVKVKPSDKLKLMKKEEFELVKDVKKSKS